MSVVPSINLYSRDDDTINSTAAVLLVLYELVAEERGIAPDQLRGTVQNDILKEYIARGTYIYPPVQSLRLTIDLMAYCHERLPQWNTISISGYHMREAGSTAVQELAFTFANAIEYVRRAQASGMGIEALGPRLSFFFNAQMDLLEEVSKFRAARRLWFRIATELLGARDELTPKLRFHVQTAGSALAAQQADVNIVRVTLQALAAVFGGAQSLHTNGFDEALGLPSERAATLALRTQQVIGFESGIPAAVDPFGGSYEVEERTNMLEFAAWEELMKILDRGGAVACIEDGYQQRSIEDAALGYARAVDISERVIVGVNRFTDDVASVPPVLFDPELECSQVTSLHAFRARRDALVCSEALARVESVAAGTENIVPTLRAALKAGATIGEVSNALRRQWGEHHP